MGMEIGIVCEAREAQRGMWEENGLLQALTDGEEVRTRCARRQGAEIVFKDAGRWGRTLPGHGVGDTELKVVVREARTQLPHSSRNKYRRKTAGKYQVVSQAGPAS